MTLPIRFAHRISGVVIGLFVLLHFANHAALFWGVDSHIRTMDAMRPLYRNFVTETVLLLAIGFQMVSGITMLWRRRKQISGVVGWLQAGSGFYVFLFLIVHLSAVFQARLSDGTDTNIYFAVAGYYAGLSGFFTPYYFLAVSALTAHIGCALYWILGSNGHGNRMALAICLIAGTLFAAALTVKMVGWLEPIQIPQSYLAKFAR
jgi:succinate dehydrogenase/fumarate reductase cytochrome b subunit